MPARPTAPLPLHEPVALPVLALAVAIGAPVTPTLHAATANPTANPALSAPGWSAHPLPVTPSGTPGFHRLNPSATGVTFTNLLSERAGTANRVLENGSGIAAGDIDGDGRTDLFFCGLSGNSALYRNLGNWTFTNVTASAGLHLPGTTCRGAVLADLNGDTRPDLLVSTLANGVLCFLNEGGRFRNATAEAGTAGPPGSTTLALADIDGNGTLDLYVTRYRADDIRDTSQVEARRVAGRTELHPKYTGRLILGPNGLIEFGEPDILYLNDGHARFSEVPWTGGRFLDEEGRPLEAAPRDWGLTASFRDLNNDRHPDLYVCNDYWTPDRLWINTGDGRFRLAPRNALRHTSENSMGVDFADIDRDGSIDLLVLDMVDPDPRIRRRQALAQTPIPATPGDIDHRPQIMRNTLHRGRPDGTFAEIAEFAGLARSGWSWQPFFLDVDLDGFEDVLIPSGHRRDVQDLDATERIRGLQHPWPATLDPKSRQEAFAREMLEHSRFYPTLESPIAAFRNLGNLRFTNATTGWGLDHRAIHQGMALADLDGDGDLDLAINPLNSAALLYRNDTPAPRITVRLRSPGPNTSAIGARVRLVADAQPAQTRDMTVGGRYLSSSEPLLCFGVPMTGTSARLEVTWPDGTVHSLTGIRRNHAYTLDASGGVPPALTTPSKPPGTGPAHPLFEDLSPQLAHRHTEPPIEDHTRQPLLPRWISQSGPGLTIGDLNGDAWPDLAISPAQGDAASIYTNDTRGRLVAATAHRPAPHPSDTLPPDRGHGPVALGLLDKDGHPDLFVAGTPIPNRYPETTPSRIYLRTPDGWKPDPLNTATLGNPGVVQGAVWGDLDGDGDSDLVLAVEWGPIRAFRNDTGQLTDVTRAWGLEPWSGLWSGITLGDLDADGRLDIVAGNWGLNSHLQATPQQPAILVHGDLLDRESVDLLETEWDAVRGTLHPRRRLHELEPILPTLRTPFPTHRAFSAATLDDVIRSFGHPVRRLEARTLATTVFLNRGNRFDPEPLPAEAQFAPAYGVLVADFDGDGHEDVFLAQNCFALPWHVPRLDAGQGLLLRGTGGGRLEPLDATRSGIRIDGEQRGAAFGDIDHDGRLDLFVGQNAGETKAYHNRGAIPGLRVRLDGGPDNPHGLGAVVQVRGNPSPGPARPVLGGSGWLSSSSPVLVLARPTGSAVLSVRWPDGQVTETPVPEGATELTVAR